MTKRQICFATHNQNKLKEVRFILSAKFDVLSLNDLGFHQEIEESGKTIEENSLIKAKTIWEKFNVPCFADDTGLEIEALGGEPGVFSARFSQRKGSELSNIDLVLSLLINGPIRKAQFKTVMTYIDERGIEVFEGVLKGKIAENPSGNYGFGYDPIFEPEGYTKTLAEIDPKEKNRISHRALALQKFCDYLS